ncbi:MAG TPA: phosphotransacetylase family protein [Armatimonadetes bacterium]|nr:phosphotransacetylase family protein [Armatimonadota bacterium]
MIPLYIASTEAYAGKSLLCMALGLKFRQEGLKISYFKPLGTLPAKVAGITTDEDAMFIEHVLELRESLDVLCPVVLTSDLLNRAMRGQVSNLRERVTAAFAQLAEGKDVVLVGGAGNVLTTGKCVDLAGPQVAELLDARVLLIAKYHSARAVDSLLVAKEILGARFLGTILNDVPPNQMTQVTEVVKPYLEQQGLVPLGAIPRDRILSSISIEGLVETLNAEVLCAEDQLGELVEHFCVGAMNVESALRHFRRVPNKAVITGGDRADVQLAALETSTKCIILTGRLYPNNLILARASELGVPLLLVTDDTYTTVERVESLLGRVRPRDEKKIQRALELLEQCISLPTLYAALGLWT